MKRRKIDSTFAFARFSCYTHGESIAIDFNVVTYIVAESKRNESSVLSSHIATVAEHRSSAQLQQSDPNSPARSQEAGALTYAV